MSKLLNLYNPWSIREARVWHSSESQDVLPRGHRAGQEARFIGMVYLYAWFEK